MPEMDKLNGIKNISIILVEPKNPGNIGSAVRAMKNMGFCDLRLVNPVEYRDVVEQRKMGYRSQEIIESSREYGSLKEAVSDLSLVFLTTTRKGKWKKDFLSLEDSAELIKRQSSKEKIGVVFGREDSGVTIDESQFANYCINIPAAVKYPSLNLAQAVMVTVHGIYSEMTKGEIIPPFPKMANKRSFDRLTENIYDLMESIQFVEEEKGLFHRSLKRALNRARWTNADIAVFDRVCKQMRWYMEISRELKNKNGSSGKS